MNDWKCEHAALGCNYPESECAGVCIAEAQAAPARTIETALGTAKVLSEGQTMNEQDKQAFEDLVSKGFRNIYLNKLEEVIAEHFWQAALEYARGKQEPVGRVDRCEFVAARDQWKVTVWTDLPVPVETDIYTHPTPAVAQEPVHFRAVLCREQQDQAHGVVPKIVGFVDKKAVEQFILEKRDFQGWRYNLEPLYTTPPAAEVNAQLLEALKEMVKMMDSGDEHGAGSDWHKKAQAAIAAAEAQMKEQS